MMTFPYVGPSGESRAETETRGDFLFHAPGRQVYAQKKNDSPKIGCYFTHIDIYMKGKH
jgi:hypothetical protein